MELRVTCSLFSRGSSRQNTAVETLYRTARHIKVSVSRHTAPGTLDREGQTLSRGMVSSFHGLPPCPTGTSNLCIGAFSMPGPVLSKLCKLAHLSLSITPK